MFCNFNVYFIYVYMVITHTTRRPIALENFASWYAATKESDRVKIKMLARNIIIGFYTMEKRNKKKIIR